MTVRKPSHAGTWYTNDKHELANQLKAWFAVSNKTLGGDLVQGARLLIGPHAGLSYSGERLAETYGAWDPSKTKRIFILGPSHHVYFKNHAEVLGYDAYSLPGGEVEVDTAIVEALCNIKGKSGRKVFARMSDRTDLAEHSFEMHIPFIHFKLPQAKIVPIMISAMDSQLCYDIVDSLTPYLDDKENAFAVLTDFCHWGQSFGFTKYVGINPNVPIEELELDDLSSRGPSGMPVSKLIELLDRRAMQIASDGDAKLWDRYIERTGNTICGQKPMSVFLRLLEKLDVGVQWTGYSQSSAVNSIRDSSVSYASGYVVA